MSTLPNQQARWNQLLNWRSVTVVNFVGLIYVTIIAFVTVVSTSCTEIGATQY